MIKSDFPKIEKLKELIKPATNLCYMEEKKYSHYIKFRAERAHPYDTVVMIVMISKVVFRENYGLEIIASVFEDAYQEKIVEPFDCELVCADCWEKMGLCKEN